MSLGWVVWVTGLPASGKSTLAWRIRRRLERERRPSLVLDGDLVRASLVPPPGYDRRGRDRFYETLALLASMLARQGLVVLVAATANRRSYRERARALAPRFLEVYVNTPLELCQVRDRKGLYARARAGRAPSLPGSGERYEAPAHPDVTATGGLDRQAVDRVLQRLRGRRASESRLRPGRPKRR